MEFTKFTQRSCEYSIPGRVQGQVKRSPEKEVCNYMVSNPFNPSHSVMFWLLVDIAWNQSLSCSLHCAISE